MEGYIKISFNDSFYHKGVHEANIRTVCFVGAHIQLSQTPAPG
jgi:hypothetical protein